MTWLNVDFLMKRLDEKVKWRIFFITIFKFEISNHKVKIENF